MPQKKKATAKKPGTTPKGISTSPATKFRFGNIAKVKYTSEYCQQMIDYFLKNKHTYPSFIEFAVSINTTVRTLENWRDNYPEFSETYEICKELQKNNIINNSLDKMYDGQFAKFLLQNHHGMKDQVEVNVEHITIKADELED